MQVDIITIFPNVFPTVFGESILKRAQEHEHLSIAMHDLRDFSHDKHRKVDDRPYGGGPGMVMRVEPIFEAVERVKAGCGAHATAAARSCVTVLMSPQGETLNSRLVQQLAAIRHLIIICGHYEGVDERVRTALVDRSLSIGDYVLTGGALPAMVLVDAVARFIPQVLGHEQATEEESFANGWLEYPQYTRPPVFRNLAVPEVLLSGDHERIAQWRKAQSVARTKASRPDLLADGRPMTSEQIPS